MPAVDNTLGALLIGTFVSLLLQGMNFHQIFHYFRLYPQDRMLLKAWVIIASTIELVNTVFSLHVCYFYLVTNYLNGAVLEAAPIWTLTATTIPSTLMILVVELFFARRLWIIGMKGYAHKVVAVVAATMNIGSFGCLMAFSTFGLESLSFASFLDHSDISTAASILNLIADIMVTAALIHVLHTSRTELDHTNSMIDMLIFYAVSTGLLLCILNTIFVTLSLVYPSNLIYAGIGIALTKVYGNTFLVALNARRYLLTPDEIRREQSFRMSSIVWNQQQSILSATDQTSQSRTQRDEEGLPGRPLAIELKPAPRLLLENNGSGDMPAKEGRRED